MRFRFNKQYFLLAIGLFITEAIIAAFVTDSIIRPYGGDFLVVIFVYSTVKSIINMPWFPASLAVLTFAFFIELLQYLHFIRWIGLEESPLARAILGSSFAWTDIAMYILGTVTIMLVEKNRNKEKL